MAKIINIIMKRSTPTGLVSRSIRQIVVWGPASTGDTADQLSVALIEQEQSLNYQLLLKSHSDIVREVCDRLFPNSWDFVAQGGAVEF